MPISIEITRKLPHSWRNNFRFNSNKPKGLLSSPNAFSAFWSVQSLHYFPYSQRTQKTISRNKIVIVRGMRPSKKQVFGRFLHSVFLHTILDSMNKTDMKTTYFNDMIQIGLNTLMPTKTVNLHRNDAPWMTGHL